MHDRFILAIGGKTSKTQGTRRCEAYDTVTNHWFQIDSLPITFTSMTGAVVMSDQEVYLMPGNCRESQTSSSLFICRLDTGPATQFPRDMSSLSYGYAMS